MDSSDRQAIMHIIAILVEKLGGEVTLTTADRVSAPEAIVTNNPDGSVTIKVRKNG